MVNKVPSKHNLNSNQSLHRGTPEIAGYEIWREKIKGFRSDKLGQDERDLELGSL